MKKGSVSPFPMLLLVALMTGLVFSSICSAEPIMVEKNLFAPDRRPPSDEPAAAATTANPAGLPARSVQLDGVFIIGDTKHALVRVRSHLTGGARGREQFPYMTVREGESIGDFQVARIDRKSIALSKDGQEYVVDLFMQGKVVPPATPLPAAPVAAPAAAEQGSPAAGAAGAPRARREGQARQGPRGRQGGIPPETREEAGPVPSPFGSGSTTRIDDPRLLGQEVGPADGTVSVPPEEVETEDEPMEEQNM